MRILRYRDWRIHWKIMVIPLISLILVIAGTELVILPRISSWLMEQEKLKVRNVVDLAYQQIAQAGEAAAAGRIPLEVAQKGVMDSIRKWRYNGKEYFWINDLTPRMIMHPTVPELDGTTLDDYKDPHGKRLFREFVQTCRTRGEGFVGYMWPKPGEKRPSPKISYVRLYQPWGWIVGSGLYVDTFASKVQELHRILLVATVTLSGALLLLAWSVGRGIKRSLDSGCGFVAAVSSGDLTRTLVVTRRDEVGVLKGSMNDMVTDLRAMIGRVSSVAGELTQVSAEIGQASNRVVGSVELQMKDVYDTSNATQEISRLIDGVAEGVEVLSRAAGDSSSSSIELAASIEEVAGNMELLVASVDGIGDSLAGMVNSIGQIDSSVQVLRETSASTASSVQEFDASIHQIESYAKESARISDDVRSDAETGQWAVDATIAGIGRIMQASQTSADAIGALSSKMDAIGSIITVIEEITQQTNLLALNASIIAAQTGAHGKSFGVVAAEIKRLAERTTRSTREIAQVIEGVQKETGRAVASIGAAEESIRDGEALSRQAGAVLDKIVDGVNRNARQMAEIARATREQACGSEMIRSAMERISSMTSTIAGSIKEQRTSGDMITAEAEKVRTFSARVMRSMKEQANVGEMISRMSQDVSEMSMRFRQACAEQSQGSGRIRNSVESIQGSAAAVHQETNLVDYRVAKLRRLSESLQTEVASFKV